MSAISSKTTVAQCYLGPISSNRKVVHGVFYRFWHPNKTGQFQAKRQLRSVIWDEFRATRKLCPTFFTGFGFLTIWANLKQNDRCAECLDESFEQQASCARCFPQVLATGQLRSVFWTSFSFLTKGTNFD